jgi:murein DD-endopeptidase MepM/ murein hydrolase activator NlpD
MASLQTMVDDLSRLTPSATERAAMARLPRAVQQQAMGGLSPEAARLALAGPSVGPDAMGVMRQLLTALETRLQTARPRMERRAALARSTPSIWPALGPLTSSYGYRRDPFTLAAALHPGLDVDVDSGTPVHATADGVVVDARYHDEYGNFVTVSHGFGIETRYAHLSRISVRPGTSLSRGQVVGQAGSTGRSTGAHVHYEVWIDGRPVNPLRYLVSREPS